VARYKPLPLSQSVTHALTNTGFTVKIKPDVDQPSVFAHSLAPDIRLTIAASPRMKSMMVVKFDHVPVHLSMEIDRRAHVMQVQELTDKLAEWESIIIMGRARGPLLISILGIPPQKA